MKLRLGLHVGILLLLFSGRAFGATALSSGNEWKVVQHATPPTLANTATLAVRTGIDKNAIKLRTEDNETHRIIVKFKDSAVARANTAKRELQVAASVKALAAVTAKHHISYEQLLRRSESELDKLNRRAAIRTGKAQPDFAGILVANLPDKGASATHDAAEALRALDCVEYVEIDVTSKLPVPPEDYAPATADLTSDQDYHLPDPGVDSTYAWSVGADGSGIRFSDCEYKVRVDHEDLVDANIEEPNPSSNYSNADHGTASMGITLAQNNGYGMRGIAPEATGAFYTEYNGRNNAVFDAIANSSAGDVVLLEMQLWAETDYAPAEFSPTLWTIVKNGTDAGVIVVSAAGNGEQDLDSAYYESYMARGDSGAIMVGAGADWHVHFRLYFSTYGSRVDVQGWGQGVATLDYGDLAIYGSDTNQSYTKVFGGTSSASAMVAGVCVGLQSYCVSNFAFRLSPLQMRQLLIDTGIPQGAMDDIPGHIGPLPNMRAAIEKMNDDYAGYWFIETTASELSVPEGGTAQLGVKLNRQPTNDVTVTVAVTAGDSDITVIDGSILSFTTNTWNSNQWVTVQAAEDSDWTEGASTLTCSLSNPVSEETITISEEENDLDPTYTLPFTETFETSDTNMASVVGDVNAQHGWEVTMGTSAVVQASVAAEGSQSCALNASSVTHAITTTVSTVWIQWFERGVPMKEDAIPRVPEGASAALYVDFDQNLVVLSNGTWVTTDVHIPTNVWTRFTGKYDYSAHTWSLWRGITSVMTDYPFFSTNRTSMESFVYNNEASTNAYLDSLVFTTSDPFYDADMDKLPDSWEVANGFSTNDLQDAERDSDDDGASNYAEYVAGSNPHDPTSRLLMAIVRPPSAVEPVSIKWASVSSREYAVWRSTDLQGSFVRIADAIQATPPENTFEDAESLEGTVRFYRIQVVH